MENLVLLLILGGLALAIYKRLQDQREKENESALQVLMDEYKARGIELQEGFTAAYRNKKDPFRMELSHNGKSISSFFLRQFQDAEIFYSLSGVEAISIKHDSIIRIDFDENYLSKKSQEIQRAGGMFANEEHKRNLNSAVGKFKGGAHSFGADMGNAMSSATDAYIMHKAQKIEMPFLVEFNSAQGKKESVKFTIKSTFDKLKDNNMYQYLSHLLNTIEKQNYKKCPYCAEVILADAVYCKHCQKEI